MELFPRIPGLAAVITLLTPLSAGADDAFRLRLLGQFSLFDEEAELKEPSGLTFDPVTQKLWTVSDNAEAIYLLDFDGGLSGLEPLEVEADDLEGIAVRSDGAIVAAREKSNEILIIDRSDGHTIARKKLEEMSGYDPIKQDFEDGPSGKGLEGLSIDRATGVVYVLKEGRPRLLLELSADLSGIADVHELTADIGFQCSDTSDKKLDVSGLSHDATRGGFWIVSDTGNCLFFYDAETRSAARHDLYQREGTTRRPLKNAEGVALNSTADILFVVTDDEDDSLFVSYEILSPVN